MNDLMQLTVDYDGEYAYIGCRAMRFGMYVAPENIAREVARIAQDWLEMIQSERGEEDVA
jgi:hypothetical protein